MYHNYVKNNFIGFPKSSSLNTFPSGNLQCLQVLNFLIIQCHAEVPPFLVLDYK